MGGFTSGRCWSLMLTISVLVALILAGTDSAYAFDGKRQGFIVGANVGFGYLTESYTATTFSAYYGSTTNTSDWQEHAPFYFGSRYGYAPTDQFLIYWSDQNAVFNRENIIWLSTISGLGASYYFKPQAPSMFVGLVTGFAGIHTLGEEYEDDLYGVGTSIDVGYEVSKHWEVGLTFWVAKPTDLSRFFRNAGIALQVRVTAY